MTIIPSVLSIQDFCSYGRCALTVTIPVLSHFGVQPIALPTSIFSNTPFFENMAVTDLTEESYAMIEAWKNNDFHFNAIQSGFLVSPEQVEIVKTAIKTFASETTMTIVDPAMADHGNLYPVFDESMIAAMADLITNAQIITPNYTEACMLTNRKYSTDPLSWDEIKSLTIALHEKGPEKVIITSIPTENNMIRTALLDMSCDQFTVIDTPKVPMDAPGTGDIFTATLTAFLLKGFSLEDATKKAVEFTYHSIKTTHENEGNPMNGVFLESLLSIGE